MRPAPGGVMCLAGAGGAGGRTRLWLMGERASARLAALALVGGLAADAGGEQASQPSLPAVGLLGGLGAGGYPSSSTVPVR